MPCEVDRKGAKSGGHARPQPCRPPMSARDEVLARIRAANAAARPTPGEVPP
jgi:hypothetical protein